MAKKKRETPKGYQTFTKALPEGILITDKDGTLVYVNPALEKMFGISSSVSVGTHFRNYITPTSARNAETAFLGCARGQIVQNIELEAVHQDRHIFPIEIAASPILRRGRFQGVESIVRDITERKRMEEALRESEQRFRAVLENSLDVAYRRDLRNNRYDYISPVVEQTLGFSPREMNEFTNDDLLARVHPKDVEQVRREFDQAMHNGVGTIEYRFRCKDDSYRWFADYFVVQKDETGQPLYISGSMRNITGLKQTERAWRSSERRFRKLFESDLMGVFITKVDGTFLDCNEAMVKMLRYDSQNELLQHRSLDLYVDPEFRREAIQILKKEGIYRGKEGRIWRKDGSIAHLLGAAVLLQDEETGESYIQGVAVDITERKQAEEALHELTRTLENKVARRTVELERRAQQLQSMALELSETEERERRRLAEVLHDDLQQQLAAAKFHVGLMRNQAQHDASLQATAARVEHMLKDAIAKSRSLSHELSPAVMRHADFAETLRWLANEVQAKHGLTVHVQADGEVHTESEVIKSLLYRAARELLFNVVKHARVSQANIHVRQCQRCICLSVSDRGCGFDPREVGETAAFGLLNLRERVELLQGRMKIKSAPGRGSTFFITVPTDEPAAAPPSSEVTTTPQGAAGPQVQDRLRVLLADDHEIVRQGLVALLSEEHTVEVVGEATNGREAVDLADQLHPDVVIMDVSMPLMSGDEATRQIKAVLPQTRVIALSMFDEADKKQRMYGAGAEGYVLKTASTEELLATIRGDGSHS